MKTLIKETRVNLLKEMHKYIIDLNNERKYLIWVTYGIPDEPIEEDYKFIAETDELWDKIHGLFMLLTADKE